MENVTRNFSYHKEHSRPGSQSNFDQDVQMQEHTFYRPQSKQQLYQSFSQAQIYNSGGRDEYSKDYSKKSKKVLTHRSSNFDNYQMSNSKENRSQSFRGSRDGAKVYDNIIQSSGPQSLNQQMSQVTTNRVYKPALFQSQKSLKSPDDNLHQSIQSKYKNVLMELQQLQEAHDVKCKELKQSNHQLTDMNINLKSLKYENNKMNEEIRRIELNVPSKKLDGAHNSIDKMQYFVNLSIEFSSQVLKAVNESMESTKDSKSYGFLNLLQQKFSDDSDMNFQDIQQVFKKNIDQLQTCLGHNKKRIKQRSDQYKEQVLRMKQNIELFKENIKLLKEQNDELSHKLYQQQVSGMNKSQQEISKLFGELRGDNESMAKELKRLEDLNKTLRNKVVRQKQKIAEQDGQVQGLNTVIKEQLEQISKQGKRKMNKDSKRQSSVKDAQRSHNSSKSWNSRWQKRSVSPNEGTHGPISKMSQKDLNQQIDTESQRLTNSTQANNVKSLPQLDQSQNHFLTTNQILKQSLQPQTQQMCPYFPSNSKKEQGSFQKTQSQKVLMKTQDTDPLVNFLQNASVYGEDAVKMNPPEILRKTQNQKSEKHFQTSMDVHAPKQKIENGQSPKTARFQSFQNKGPKQTMDQRGPHAFMFQTTQLQRAQSSCLPTHMGYTQTNNLTVDNRVADNCDLSQLSRDNIKKNTKSLQCEIKDVDHEIAALQDSLINELMQSSQQPPQIIEQLYPQSQEKDLSAFQQMQENSTMKNNNNFQSFQNCENHLNTMGFPQQDIRRPFQNSTQQQKNFYQSMQN